MLNLNFTPIAIIRGCTARFVSDLLGRPYERFSRDAAQIITDLLGNPYERFSRDAAQIITTLCFITQNILLLDSVISYSIEQLSRIIKWHAPKVENLLTPAQNIPT